MIAFNTTVLDKDYSTIDTPLKLKTVEQYGLPEEFYGGRVTFIGEMKDSPIKLLLDNSDGLQVIDVAVDKVEDIPLPTLRHFAKVKNVEIERTDTREQIASKLSKFLLVI